MNACRRHVPCIDTNPHSDRIEGVEDSGFISVVPRAYQGFSGDLEQVLSRDPIDASVFSELHVIVIYV